MNIREIEQELGIPRANVRYYEKEGLLHPQRSANNYRVYTEEDVDTLKKIRLLRQLDMPVETIRAVQSGEIPLADALASQAQLLENESAKLERAGEICRSMLADGATYPALDPARYESVPAALPGQRIEPPEAKRPPVEGAEWAFNPWQRYWARTFDLGLTYSLASAVLALVFHTSVVNTRRYTWLLRIFLLIMAWALEFVLEPLLLSAWGTTPGKWLLGLELRDKTGEKLSLSQGRWRIWGVLGTGYGFGSPVYGWYRMYSCYRKCRENKPLEYDDEEGFLYYSKVPGRWQWRAALSVVLSLLLIPVQVWCTLQGLLPPNRGEVTAAEFAENVNAVAGYLDYSLWVNEDGFELSSQSIMVSYDGGPWEERRYGEPFSDTPVYTVETDEAGYVTAVCIERESRTFGEDDEAIWLPSGDLARVVMASFRGAWCSGYDMLRGPAMEMLDQSAETWNGQPVQDGRFTLTVLLEKQGYQTYGSSLFIFSETGADEHWYHFVLRLEKTG